MGVFHAFLNCTNGTKSCKTSHIVNKPWTIFAKNLHKIFDMILNTPLIPVTHFAQKL